MKKILIAVCFMVLAGCGNSVEQYTPQALPPELADCKFYNIQQGGSFIRLVRCPSSSVSLSYRSGKTTQYVTVAEE